MKKSLVVMLVLALIVAVAPAYAGNGRGKCARSGDCMQDRDRLNLKDGSCTAAVGPHGSAPNSGDGIPDGSGFDGHYGPNA